MFLIVSTAILTAGLTVWVGWFLAGTVGPSVGYILLPIGLIAVALLRWRSR
jgi:hypothetical protein